EIEKSGGIVVEQIVRPTGIVDPEVIIRPTEGQIEDLIERMRQKVEKRERVLVTTLTKRMAEDLAEYLNEIGFRVRYLHSEIDAIERVEILRGLRLGEFDVLVGINLLREGLDLPEVALVAILDADKEGFLRDERSLIQTAGRAARNVRGEVVLYADNITGSIQRAVAEMARRRKKQLAYNRKHKISPRTVTKTTEEVIRTTLVADAHSVETRSQEKVDISIESLAQLKKELDAAVAIMDFEKAIILRDRIKEIRDKLERKKGRRSHCKQKP
ncbi:MAG: helicase-related protein, partial [candidate division WOR-3 bacterium]